MANEAFQNMSLMMGMMGQIDRADYMEKHGKVFDMQAQKMAEEKAALDASPGLFRQMQEDPQFMDKYRPQTATDLAAFANARKQYLDTQEGQIKSFQNLTARAQQNYQAFAAPAREALAAYDKGDTQRAMDLMQTASAHFPDPMRITGYDPSTGEAVLSKPNAQTGGYDEVGRKSTEELMQMTKTMLAGGRVRTDGVEINPEFAKAYGLTAFAASEENHKLAQEFAGGKVKTILQSPDGKIIHAAPQYDFQSHDYNYFVPGQGFMSKQQLTQSGFGFTTEQSVQQGETARHNRVAEGLAAEGHDIQRDAQDIQRQRLKFDQEGAKNDTRLLGEIRTTSALYSREKASLLKEYAPPIQLPADATPEQQMAALLQPKVQQDALLNMQRKAEQGDERSKASLQRFGDIDHNITALNDKAAAITSKSVGVELRGMGNNAPVQPSQTDRGLGMSGAPVQQPQQAASFPSGAVRDAQGQVYAPVKDRVAGAVQKKVNGVVGWYVPHQ